MFFVSTFPVPCFRHWANAKYQGFIGLYGPIFYLASYAVSNNIMSEDLAFYLLPVLNAASIFGRIIPVLTLKPFSCMLTDSSRIIARIALALSMSWWSLHLQQEY
jgi:hypothetical protein